MGSETLRTNESMYDISRYGPRVENALRARAAEILSANPVTPQITAKLFKLEQVNVTEAQMEYLRSYLNVVLPQLVAGAYFSPNFNKPGKERTEEQMLLAIEAKDSGLMAAGFLFWHDIGHSIVALTQAQDKSRTTAVLPLYMTHTQNSTDYPDERTRLAAVHYMTSDERLADLWSEYSGESIKRVIDNCPNVERFIETYTGSLDEYPNEPAVRVLTRIYKEFKTNPNIMFTIFMEESKLLMSAHAPKALRAISKSTNK